MRHCAEGICKFLWRPRPTWANARGAEVVAIQLRSFPEFNKGLLEITMAGTFAAEMSFRQFPRVGPDG